jgi:hypothetical protein
MKLGNTVTIQMNGDDFDLMSNCRMEFNDDWLEQIKDGRFEDLPDKEYRYIYWFDSRLCLILAEAFLKSIGWECTRSFDTYQDQDVLLTNYVVA